MNLTVVALMAALSLTQAIEKQLENHPESRLQDIYKSFFQEKFGPGHIIPSKASAEKYLREELSECEGWTDPLPVEELGREGRFVRVSLMYLKSGEMAFDDYLDAFVAGAREITDKEYKEWIAEWKEVADAAAAFDIPSYAQDRAEIDKMLKEKKGKLVLHHSEEYNKAYEPHYRIIEKSRFLTLQQKSRYSRVGPKEFSYAISNPGNVVLDVRTADEHSQKHIPGTEMNIDVQKPDFEKKLKESIPAGSTVAIYCRSGRRSKTAAEILLRNSYRVIELDEGINSWF